MGMRGTASHDIVVEDVFVPDERVLANRPFGVIDPPLQVIVTISMSIISGAYLGVAEAAFAAAVDAAATRGDDPLVQRQIGLMAHRLQVASWALDGALDRVGDDPAPDAGRLGAVLAAKREVALAGIEVCDVAMDVAGGAAYAKGSTIERCYWPWACPSTTSDGIGSGRGRRQFGLVDQAEPGAVGLATDDLDRAPPAPRWPRSTPCARPPAT